MITREHRRKPRGFIRAEDRLRRKPKQRPRANLALIVALSSLAISITSAVSTELSSRSERRALVVAELLESQAQMHELHVFVSAELLREQTLEAEVTDPEAKRMHRASANARIALLKTIDEIRQDHSASLYALRSPSRWMYWTSGLDDTRAKLINDRAMIERVTKIFEQAKVRAGEIGLQQPIQKIAPPPPSVVPQADSQ